MLLELAAAEKVDVVERVDVVVEELDTEMDGGTPGWLAGEVRCKTTILVNVGSGP